MPAAEGLPTPLCPPAPRPSQPPRCRRHRCAGGGLPRAGEGAAAVRAAAAAAVLPLRYVGGGWLCFTPFPSPARLRGPQRGVAPRARRGGGRSVCLPAPSAGRSAAGRPCRGWLRGDGTTGPGGPGACAVGAPGRLLVSRLGLTGRVANGEDRGGGQANGGLSDLSGSRCRGEVKRRWRRSALAAPFRVTSNFARQGQRDLPASWRRSGGGGQRHRGRRIGTPRGAVGWHSRGLICAHHEPKLRDSDTSPASVGGGAAARCRRGRSPGRRGFKEVW